MAGSRYHWLLFACGIASLIVPASKLQAGDASGNVSMASICDGYSFASWQLPAQTPATAQTLPQAAIAARAEPAMERPVLTKRLNPVARRWRANAGFEFGWLQPRFSENVAAIVTRPTGNRVLAYDFEHELTPRVWVGIENCNRVGLRAGYWYFETDAPTGVYQATAGYAPISRTIVGASGGLSRTAVANVGDAMTTNHHLEAKTIELELTKRIVHRRGDWTTALGLQYAKVDQRSHAVATDGVGALTELVCQDILIDGFGPTLAAACNHRLFCCDGPLGGLGIYGHGRTSLLFGRTEQEIVLVTGGGAGLAEDDHQQDSFLPIISVGGGLRWMSQPRGFGSIELKTGYRGESWFSVGGPSDFDSNLGFHGVIFSIAWWRA